MPNATASRVHGYLDELDRALSDLPRDRRSEIVRDIRGHIDVALAERGEPSAAEVEQVLEELGTPQEIAEAAYAEVPRRTRARIEGRDVFTIIALLLGGFVFFVGWVVGVVLLWTSDSWSTKEKVVGTLLVPGGLLAPLLVAGTGGFAVSETTCSSAPQVVTAATIGQTAKAAAMHCTSTGAGTTAMVLGFAVLAISVFGPIYTTAMLISTARRWP